MKKINETNFRNSRKIDTIVVVVEKTQSLIPIGIFNATIAHVAIFEKAETKENCSFVKVTFEFDDGDEKFKTNRNFPIKWFQDSYLRQFLRNLSIEVEEGQDFDFSTLIGLDVKILIEEIENNEGKKYNCLTAVELV